MKKIRVGIAGLANHGVTIRNAALATKQMEVVSVFDIDEKVTKEFAETAKCEAAKNYEELVNNESIDAIILVTPNQLHLDQSVKAFEKGKHVFLEKPITNTVQEGVELVKQANKYKKILLIGHNMRKKLHFVKAKNDIAEGKIGKVVAFYSNFSHDGGFNPNMPKWKSKSDTCPLLPMMQLGIHFIDSINFMVDEVKKINCWASSVAMGNGILDSTLANIELRNGVMGTLQSHYIIPAIFELKVFGTKGTVYVSSNMIETTYNKDGENVIEKDVIDEVVHNSYEVEIAEFADCILENKKPEVDGVAGLKALAAIEAMIKSINENRTIEMDEVLSPEVLKGL